MDTATLILIIAFWFVAGISVGACITVLLLIDKILPGLPWHR